MDQLPNDKELEGRVLGTLINCEDIAIEYGSVLTSDIFYDSRNKIIADTIIEMYKNGEAIDIVTVSKNILSSGNSDNIGGLSYVSSVSNIFFGYANFDEHLRILQELALRRNIILQCTKSISMASDPMSDPLDVATNVSTIFDKQLDSYCDNTSSSASDVAVKMFQELTERRAQGHSGLLTAFRDIDGTIGGLYKSKLYILAARPGCGKTSLAMNMAVNIAQQGKKVLFISMEMANYELMQRIVSYNTDISCDEMDRLNISDKDMETIANECGVIGELPLLFDDTASMRISQIRTKIKKVRPDVVFIDYLQLIGYSNERGKSTNDYISDISRQLKIIAKELDIPIILLSQLNRDVEKRGGHRPQLSDLRDSGAIEQDADCVIFLNRLDEGGSVQTKYGDRPSDGIVTMIVAKNRSGRCGDVHLRFNSRLTKFEDLETYNDFVPHQFDPNANFESAKEETYVF